LSRAPTLTTERLTLRAYSAADFEPYAAMWAEPAVVRYIGGVPVSREESWSRFLRQFGMWEHLGFGFFVVEDRATGAFVGEVGFQERLRDLKPSIEGTLETGWGFVPAAQGQGFATEAVGAALDWAHAAFPARRFTALINRENGASLRLAEKLGFQRFAEVVYHGMPAYLYQR
jgi:RimJ/RimL family protein N-acetyltransferase